MKTDIDEGIIGPLQEAMFALATLFSMRAHFPGLSWRQCLDTMLSDLECVRQRARELSAYDLDELERSLQRQAAGCNMEMLTLMLAMMGVLLRLAEDGKARAALDILLDKVVAPVCCPEDGKCLAAAEAGSCGYNVCRQCWLEWLEKQAKECGNG